MAVISSVEKVRVQLEAGVQYVVCDTKNEYTKARGDVITYDSKSYDLEGLEDGIAGLAQLAKILKNIPEEGFGGMGYDEAYDTLKEWAADVAECAGLPFTFEDRTGRTHEYTPAVLWEASS